ncbi:MAG: dihydrofolate reductase [Variibacter sp.]
MACGAGRALMQVVLVAAVAENGVIGHDNAMPWRLKSDLKRFRALTTGKPVIMGRKTFQSLGRPLKDRTNVVVSRDAGFSAVGAVVVATIEAALEVARGDALRRGVDEIIIGGGSHVYGAFLPIATRIEITLVHATPDGDTRFPPIDPAGWEEVSRIAGDRALEDTAPTTWLTYARRGPPVTGN